MESITAYSTDHNLQTALGSYFGVIAKKQTYLNLAYLLARSMGLLINLLIIMVILLLAFLLVAIPLWILTWLVYDPGPILKFAPLVMDALIAIPLLALLAYPAAVLEQKLASWLLQVQIPVTPFLTFGPGFLAGAGRYFFSKPAWKRVLFLLLSVPLGFLSFVTVMIALPLNVILLAMPAAFLSGFHNLILWDMQVSRLGESMLLSLLAIPLLPLVLHISNRLARFSGWIAKELLPG